MSGIGRQSRLSAPAIRRILAAADPGSSRPFLDVVALARCIDVCADLYDDAKSHNTKAVEKKRRGELTKALKTASRLKDQLVSIPDRSFLTSYDQAFIQVSKLVEEIRRLIDFQSTSRFETGLEYDYVDSLAYADHFKSRSPLQWMVGVYLADVYELFFGVLKGPGYLTFAHQVLKELKIKDGSSYYSRAAIARAARGYSRKRKLAPAVNQDEWAFDRARRFSWACGIHESLDTGTELRKREQTKATANASSD